MKVAYVATPEHIAVYGVWPEGRVAVVEASRLEVGQWYLNRANVPYQHRGQGVGSRLLRELLDRVRVQGGRAVVVDPGGYGEDPEEQQHFYEKNGFRQITQQGYARWEWRP